MNNIQSITADIASIEAASAADRKLADQLAAMQAATQRVAASTATLAGLRERLAAAQAAEAAHTAIVARYNLVSIKTNESTATAVAAHNATFTERLQGLNGPEVAQRTYALHGLSSELLDVVAADPDKVPVYILALADDVKQALREHARNVSRGYMTTPTAQGQYVPASNIPGVTFAA